MVSISYSHVLACRSSQGGSPAISLPCGAFSTWGVLPWVSPIPSYPNPSKYHLKHYFQETSRSPLGRMPFPSVLTGYLHSILFCMYGTVSESQVPIQGKQSKHIFKRMNKHYNSSAHLLFVLGIRSLEVSYS